MSETIRAYTFCVVLLGSRNPPITRTFTLPASSTFQRLHHAIQYTFGWHNSHLHEFTFEPTRTENATGLISFDPRTVLMAIAMGQSEDDDFIRCDSYFEEKELKLSDVWEGNGKARKNVLRNGQVVPLYYLYDFGDNWDHKIDFVSSSMTSQHALKIVGATGCGPLDDSGGVTGWESVKNAFLSPHPTTDQRELKSWAREASPLGHAFSPSKAPNLESLNKMDGFEKFVGLCRQGEGDGVDDESPNNTLVPAAVFLTQVDPNLDLTSLPRIPTREGPFNERIGPPIFGDLSNRRFMAQSDVYPLDLFKPAINACSCPAPRWVHTDEAGKVSVLIFTDGAAPNNGRPDARAGFGVVFRPDGQSSISFPLEHSQEGHAPTSNRAELRAVIAALRLRYWPGEGFARIVIGTDSEYVVRGICEFVFKWQRKGWRTIRGTPVKNQDLWRRLVTEVETAEKNGVSVQFWLVKREWNVEADRRAKAGAENPDIPSEFTDICAMMV